MREDYAWVADSKQLNYSNVTKKNLTREHLRYLVTQKKKIRHESLIFIQHRGLGSHYASVETLMEQCPLGKNELQKIYGFKGARKNFDIFINRRDTEKLFTITDSGLSLIKGTQVQ